MKAKFIFILLLIPFSLYSTNDEKKKKDTNTTVEVYEQGVMPKVPFNPVILSEDVNEGVYEDASYSEMEMEVSTFPSNIPPARISSDEVEPIHKETIKSENFSVTSVFES